jgi:dTDP-L-rhamnose 4-epimerase
LNKRPPLIFEDGRQQRDFVSVQDVTQACRLALETDDAKIEAAGRVFNVGSGRPYTVREVAEKMARVLGCQQIKPEITGQYRVGDIRHCFAAISLARETLGYAPRATLEEGIKEIATWLEGRVAIDRVVEARAEFAARGLTV